MSTRRKFLSSLSAAALALCSLGLGASHAQAAYPEKPVTLLVPYSAGGPTDLIARQLAQGLGELWGQSVVVENRTGASGIVALSALNRAAPDGYTLGIMVTPVTAIAPLTQKDFRLDVTKDFTAITDLVDYALVLLAGPQAQASTLKELIDRAKADPQAISYGSSGIGGTNHLAGEIFSRAAGAPMLHVPYKGNAPAISDAMGGQISFVFAQTDAAIGLADSGKFTALAITSGERNPAVPNIPTLAEQGLDVRVEGWTGVMGPAGMPAEIVKTLEDSIAKVKDTPAFKEKMESLGFVITPTSSEAFTQRVQEERDFWKKKIEDENIPLQ
ncbi:tripartite tricarboxylate transporter substrate binding protein [Alcaligenaceae bacterium]|nr:tripartite tricarboxylate transporter substrate binding protein [Alcaligenaceae bacterium]